MAATYYFSPSGSNSNPGTQASPKRDATGINVNNLGGGSTLYFQRGGTYNWPAVVVLENTNTTAAAPISFDAYGTGALPLIDSAASFIYLGHYVTDRSFGFYNFRNLRLQGRAADRSVGIFFVTAVNDVTIENVQIENFNFGIQSTSGAPTGVRNVTIRNSSISRNTSIGILGQFADTLIEGNTFEGNNTSGSGFEHGTYLSGNAYSGRNLTLRNNTYLRNSVVNGVCTGGNMTFHGQIDGLLIEGNTIQQDSAAAGCWLMSITQGYTSAEWFRNLVVRNNKLINGGNTGMAIQSAPGALIEGNVVFNNQNTNQAAISLGSTEYTGGDVADGSATVRDNTACYTSPLSGSAVLRNSTIGAVLSNNLMLTGPLASTGACAR